MKKICGVIVSFMVMCVMVSTTPAQAEGPAFWRIKTPTNTIYIFGSVHVLEEKLKFTKQVKDAFKESENLVVEVDVRKIGPTQTNDNFYNRGGMMNLGWSLPDVLTPDLYYDVQVKASEYGLNMTMLNAMAPWAVADLLARLPSPAQMYQKNKISFKKGVDHHFITMAQRHGKPILELERFEDQYRINTTIPVAVQTDMIKSALHKINKPYLYKDHFKDMVDAWRTGDIEALEMRLWGSLKYEGKDLSEAIYNRMFVERNKNWIPVIESYLGQDEDYFIVAGAGHFVGPDGVITLLALRGHPIERID